MKHQLEIDSVQKSFATKRILSDVYLRTETGNIIGILGRNGCGKSTLFKIIFGTLGAENKFVRIDNVIHKKPYFTREITYLPQDNFIPKHLKVSHAITLYISKDKREEFLNDVLIERIKHQKIKHLSGGEQRYLEIKLILYTSSKFVLLDEPYNGLAPNKIDLVNQLILDSAKHKGIILSDHAYSNVLHVANRICLINNGALYDIKDKKELVRFGYLTDAMLASV